MAKSDFNFFYPFRVRYSEIDAQAIVFNAHYLTYFDTAVTEYLRALPYDYFGQLERTGTDFHVVKSVVEYKAPIHFDEEIETHVRTAKIGRSSNTFALEIHPKGEDRLLTSGEVIWVNADQSTEKSCPVPPELVALITAHDKP